MHQSKIMISTSYTRLLALFCVLTIGVLAGCKKEETNGNNGQVQLFSFGPTGAKHGDTLRFIGLNLDQVTAIQFTGENAIVEKKDFKLQTSELIKLIVPAAAEKGLVTLKTGSTDIVTKTQLNLGVTTSVSAITPQARPGENITLTGEYLNWVKRITFAQNKEVENFVSQSFNQLVVTVPEDAQTGPLMVFYGGTDSAEIETVDTVHVTLPHITSFSPNPIKHQQNVTINGTDLDLVKKVIFTNVPTPVTEFVSQSASQLVVKVPAATMSGAVTLEAASGVQTTKNGITIIFPAVSTISPNPVAPGSNVTLTGTDLDLVTSITFENAPAVTEFVSQSATKIVVKAPMGITRGQLTFGVLNSTVTVKSADVLEVEGDLPPPTIAYWIYNDAVTSNWSNNGGWVGGGWGGTVDYNNSSPVREGFKSIKVDYVGGYGSPLQLGGANISTVGYTTLKLSVFGAPGSEGKKVTVGLNGTNGKFTFNAIEGKWTDYAIPLTTLMDGTTLKEIWVQEFGGSGGFTIYVDAIGLN